MKLDDLSSHLVLHEPFKLVGDDLQRQAQVVYPGSVVVSSRNRAVDVVGKPVGILEYLEAPGRRDEGAAQAVNGDGEPGV